MTSKKFLKALVDLGACREARIKIGDDHHTLRQFWISTDREDWMVWLCIRVGLWERVRVLVEKSIDHKAYAGTVASVSVSFDTSWSGLLLAANESAAFDYIGPHQFCTDLRSLLTWQEIETAINETIEKEKDNE